MTSSLPWLTFQQALRGFRKQVAADLGMNSASYVDRWCMEPSAVDGTGQPNPLQRLTEIAMSLRKHGNCVGADAIVRAFNVSLGYVPPVRTEALADGSALADAADVTMATSGYLAAEADEMRDGLTTIEEQRRSCKASGDLLREAARVHLGNREQLAAMEAAELVARMRPNASKSLPFMQLTNV